MNTIKTGMIVVVIVAISIVSANAQSFKVAVSNASSKTLHIKEVNRVSVEAYDGAEILIEGATKKDEAERAEGLKPLSARGQDNTGIGLNVTTEGNDVNIFQVVRREQGKYTIKVPKAMKVEIEHTGQWEGGKIEVYGITNELEISGRYNSVYMENITGPALVNTVYGEVEAKFSTLSQSGPTSIVSVYSNVDITLPADAKANVKLHTPYGEAYSDLNIEFPKNLDMRKISSTVEGTLNGGGVQLDVKATYNNIYLRKK